MTYWEGAARIYGTVRKQPVSGSGYVEMAGYAGKMSNGPETCEFGVQYDTRTEHQCCVYLDAMTEAEKTLLAGCIRGDKAAWDAFDLEEERSLSAALESLSAKERLVINLHFQQGLPAAIFIEDVFQRSSDHERCQRRSRDQDRAGDACYASAAVPFDEYHRAVKGYGWELYRVLVNEGSILRSRDNFQVLVDANRPAFVYVLIYDVGTCGFGWMMKREQRRSMFSLQRNR